MEETEVVVVGVDQLQENPCVLLLEEGLLGVVLLVRNRLLFFLHGFLWAEYVFRVGQHDVEPNIFFDLFYNVRE